MVRGTRGSVAGSTEAPLEPHRLYCTQLMVETVSLTPPLTTSNRELVSVLEVESRALGSNQGDPMQNPSQTLPTLPRAGCR